MVIGECKYKVFVANMNNILPHKNSTEAIFYLI